MNMQKVKILKISKESFKRGSQLYNVVIFKANDTLYQGVINSYNKITSKKIYSTRSWIDTSELLNGNLVGAVYLDTIIGTFNVDTDFEETSRVGTVTINEATLRYSSCFEDIVGYHTLSKETAILVYGVEKDSKGCERMHYRSVNPNEKADMGHAYNERIYTKLNDSYISVYDTYEGNRVEINIADIKVVPGKSLFVPRKRC